jgi:hypothetical protein
MIADMCFDEQIEGIYFELRQPSPSDESKPPTKTMLYQESGEGRTEIRLEVSTHRTMHPETEFCDTGFTTRLTDEQIIWTGTSPVSISATSYDCSQLPWFSSNSVKHTT